MKEQGLHEHHVASSHAAELIAFKWDLRDLPFGNDRAMRARDDAERAARRLAVVEMEAQSDQGVQDAARWLCVRETVLHASNVAAHFRLRHQAILVSRHGPIHGAPFVEEERVDRDRSFSDMSRGKRREPRFLEGTAQSWNAREQTASREDRARAVTHRPFGRPRIAQRKQSISRERVDRSADDDEAGSLELFGQDSSLIATNVLLPCATAQRMSATRRLLDEIRAEQRMPGLNRPGVERFAGHLSAPVQIEAPPGCP